MHILHIDVLLIKNHLSIIIVYSSVCTENQLAVIENQDIYTHCMYQMFEAYQCLFLIYVHFVQLSWHIT